MTFLGVILVGILLNSHVLDFQCTNTLDTTLVVVSGMMSNLHEGYQRDPFYHEFTDSIGHRVRQDLSTDND